MKSTYEADDKTFPAPAYAVAGYRGIAWYVLGWETTPDEDTEWTGIRVRTGKIICRMVGDDTDFRFEVADVTALNEDDYCAECGQLGCTADGRVR